LSAFAKCGHDQSVPSLASPGIFCSADEPKRDFLSLERRHSVTVDQRDLSARTVVHPVDTACCDEVARLDDKVLHANSIREKSVALNAVQRDWKRVPRRISTPTGYMNRGSDSGTLHIHALIIGCPPAGLDTHAGRHMLMVCGRLAKQRQKSSTK
jgi:hypothetical protein